MGRTVGWGWLDQGFERISELHNPLLRQLISPGKLRLRFPSPKLDSVDIHAASLVGAGLATHQSLCIVLPDTNPRRPAFLFAYALLGTWVRLRGLGLSQLRPVLYCGVRPGIRDQLSQVTISGLGVTLDGIFDQVHLARASGAEQVGRGEEGLPRVITAFGPANAVSLLDNLKPTFVAVDLADAPKAVWLSDLLAGARERNISVVAWSTNPLSEAITQFAKDNSLVKFPTCRSYGGHCNFGSDETSEPLFQPFITTTVRPLVVTERAIRDHDANLRLAIECLRTIDATSRGSLTQSAIQIHWRLLRAIENLAVPLSFYEAESAHIWGLRSIATLRETCEHFQASVKRTDREVANQLERSIAHLDVAVSFLTQNDPPFWAALTQMIHSEPPADQARVIVFPSQARKEIFSLALLAKLNIALEDLEPLRTWITTLPGLQLFAESRQEVAREASILSIPESLELMPILVGLPTIGQTPRLLPFFFSEEAGVVVHEYQRGWLRPSVERWDDGLSPNLATITDFVDVLARLPRLQRKPLVVPHRVSLSAARALLVDTQSSADVSFGAGEPLWDTPQLENEVRYLFDDEDDDSSLAQDRSADGGDDGSESDTLAVDRAYEVTFAGGWCGVFAGDQQLNFVVPSTRKVEERFVRALRVGDTALIIPSQPRQSLYTLIISRVHQHPSIELHLALLRRWREELQSGFQRWAKQHRDPVSRLHAELTRAGSTVTSTLALRFWLNGSTLCPADVDDVLRVAEVLDLPFVRSRYRQIENAASRIRGLHRGLSNRLNRWLNDQARASGDSHDAEVIDPALGLTFGDLRSSLIVTDVASIREVQGPFLRDTLGYIQRASDNDTRRAIA